MPKTHRKRVNVSLEKTAFLGLPLRNLLAKFEASAGAGPGQDLPPSQCVEPFAP